jgi:hypothetical protein
MPMMMMIMMMEEKEGEDLGGGFIIFYFLLDGGSDINCATLGVLRVQDMLQWLNVEQRELITLP